MSMTERETFADMKARGEVRRVTTSSVFEIERPQATGKVRRERIESRVYGPAGETGSGRVDPQADNAQAAPGDGETSESESTTGETSRVELLPVGGRSPESVVFECGAAMAARLSRETRTIKVPVRAAFEVIRDHGTGWDVSRVVWDDGTESYAKWFYDRRTALYRLGAGAYGDSVFARETAHGPAFDPDAAAGNNPDAGLRDGETPADAFRDWSNHYLTPECFAEHRGITPDAARELIARGRREHESGAAG